MNPEGNGEISNEFFKKLNQQIVQKDNLIKLLQLQIRNLKTQVDAGGADSEKIEEFQKQLEEKSSEADRLLAELELQKQKIDEIEQQKDEQIKSLSQMLEEQQSGGSAGGEVIDDPRVEELESAVAALREELENEKQARAELESQTAQAGGAEDQSALQQELDILRAEVAASANDKQEIQDLKIAVEAARVELEQANTALESAQTMAPASDGAQSEELEFYKGRVLELEQDVVNLKNLLADNAEANGGADNSEALASAQFELEQLKAKLAEAEAGSNIPAPILEELEKLRQESSEVEALKERLATAEKEAEGFAEAAMKLTALESEREQLVEEIDGLKASSTNSTEVDSHKVEIARLREANQSRDEEIAKLRVSLEARQDESMNDPEIQAEVEQLTQQVADQLLAIQNFEGILSKTREQLQAKDEEIQNLKSLLSAAANRPQENGAIIPVEGESELIGSFIDFFDGLDSIISKNPIPELMGLHQKLLDRLIVPNQISYMPVISEEFSPDKHIATDYFRSEKFPDRCIVFEVEKGYSKGDTVIKKSKVWVVQNLFECQACNSKQSNSDSRFCHMCGTKIVAPNGLPIDTLPEFEPTPSTYQRFASSMIARKNQEQAKFYLQAGLDLDPDYVPLMIGLADIYASESRFEEAVALLKKANQAKEDAKLVEKIQALEVKLNIFKQAKALNLPPEEFDKLIHLIQK